jgi:hypothetical protein
MNTTAAELFMRRGGDFIGPITDPLAIPQFLRLTREERLAGWNGFVACHAGTSEPEEAWQLRERERRAAIDAEIKIKKLAGLQAMKDKHRGEKWDPKLCKWVPVTAAVKLDLGSEK